MGQNCFGQTYANVDNSDGKTPEEQTKQILAIAAILPGQTPDTRFAIPERKNSVEQQPSQQAEPQEKEQASTQNGDLIDLSEGQSTPRPEVASTEQAHPDKDPLTKEGFILQPQTQDSHPGKFTAPPPASQKPSQPVETSDKTHVDDTLASGVQKLNVSGAGEKSSEERPDTLRRMDSESQGFDEFHDAES